MHPDLEEFAQQTRENVRDADHLVQDITDEQLNWQIAAGVWSIGQCLDHLNVSARVYLSSIDETIDAARQKGLTGTGPFRYGWITRQFVKSLEPPVKLKLKAPKKIKPAAIFSKTALINEFRAVREEILQRLERSDGIDLQRSAFRSPLLRLLKIELGQAFAVLCAHDRRHLWQARQVLQHPQFPN